MDYQNEKRVVRDYHEALTKADADDCAEVLAQYTAPDWHWRGMHPFHEQHGAKAVADVFWTPLKRSVTSLQRRPDIFAAGLNEIDGFKSVWVVSMGHLMGLFDHPWLGIRPNRRITMLRYAEFNKVENGKITETAMFCDIPAVMIQAGQNPFPPQTGAHLVQPGPMTHEGVMYDAQDPEKGKATLAAINFMVNQLTVRSRMQTEEGRRADLLESWHDDMIWWGPAGIGATYTIERYMKQHAEPFVEAFARSRVFNGHLCKLAEGNFGGFFGWANLTLQSDGGFMGMHEGAKPADMRVVDMYRAQDGKLVENWIFIDMLHYLNMQGLDVLARMERLNTC